MKLVPWSKGHPVLFVHANSGKIKDISGKLKRSDTGLGWAVVLLGALLRNRPSRKWPQCKWKGREERCQCT